MKKRNAWQRSGITLIYVTIAILAALAMASLAIDFARVRLAKSELQAAIDAAGRYGVTGFATDVATAKSRAISLAAQNMVDGTPLVIDQNSDIEVGTWNFTTHAFTPLTGAAESTAKAIRITAQRSAARGTAIPLIFGCLLGQPSCDLRASTVVTCYGKANDVFLIQDITTSFVAQLPDAKIADQALLDSLNSAGGGRLAIAVHTGWGTTLTPLTSITSNYALLTSKIASIQIAGSSGMPVASGTDIASGFDEAITAYSASDYVAPTGNKTVVLVSDGQPTANSSGKHPTFNDAQLLTLAQTRADTLWANDVHVYIVFMDASNDTVAANRLKTLIRGKGTFVRVADPTLLPAALTDITYKIGNIVIVK